MDNLVPLNYVAKAFIPAFFVVAKDDDFVYPKHGKLLYEKYGGDKVLKEVEGSHNSTRPEYVINSIFIFLYNTM